jgi:HKD family nuclease
MLFLTKYYLSILMTEIDETLYQMLNDEFNTKEKQIFIQHFRDFLHKSDDFVISIEFAFK